MILPADYARCLNDKCPKQATCARRIPAARPEGLMRRVYAAFQPDENEGCDHYIPVQEEKEAAGA